MKKKLLFFALAILLLGMIISRNHAKQKAISDCIATAQELAEKYGISLNEVIIKDPWDYEGKDVYPLQVTGSFERIRYEKLYLFVNEIDAIIIDIDNAFLLPKIKLNDDYYEIDVLNKKQLNCNREKVYTYVSNEEAVMMSRLRDELPYEGLPEKYINYTLLGTPDDIERCIGYYEKVARAKSVRYTWYDDNDKLQAIANVWYWDYATDREVEGYINSISWYGEYSK